MEGFPADLRGIHVSNPRRYAGTLKVMEQMSETLEFRTLVGMLELGDIYAKTQEEKEFRTLVGMLELFKWVW